MNPDGLPPIAAMPVFVVTGKPYSRPHPETEHVRRALASSGVLSWPRAVARVARHGQIDPAEAEARLVRALRDPRRLLTALYIRKTDVLAVSVAKNPQTGRCGTCLAVAPAPPS